MLDPRPLETLDQLDDLQLDADEVVFEPWIRHGPPLPGTPAPHPGSYDPSMATATPGPTPNPNALRFSLDTSLDGTISAASAAEAAGNPFLEALLAIDGVASVFGTADFVTVTRTAGADWDAIVPAVQAAAADHL